MQIVVGIDHTYPEQTPPVVPLLRHLNFPTARYELVHVLPPPIPAGWPAEMVIAAEALVFHQQEETARVTDYFGRLAPHLGGDVESVGKTILDGSPAERLIAHADAVGANLVAVTASHRGPLERILVGSVARALVVGAHQNVLLARPHTGDSKPLRAVFATDHSPYSVRCATELLRLAPRGIDELVIVSAYSEPRLAALAPLVGKSGISPAEAMREAVYDRNAALEREFSVLAPSVRSLVLPAEPNDALRQAIEEVDAQLLILGAQGHGFWDRITMGSVSFHQALTAACSVLILRV